MQVALDSPYLDMLKAHGVSPDKTVSQNRDSFIKATLVYLTENGPQYMCRLRKEIDRLTCRGDPTDYCAEKYISNFLRKETFEGSGAHVVSVKDAFGIVYRGQQIKEIKVPRAAMQRKILYAKQKIPENLRKRRLYWSPEEALEVFVKVHFPFEFGTVYSRENV